MNGGTLNRAGLTLRQATFVTHYLRTKGNGEESARRAGYRSSPEGLRVIASQNLTKLNIQRELQRRMSAKLSTAEIEAEIVQVAQSPVLVTETGKMKALDLLTKINGMVTQKVETVDVTERDSFALTLYAHITDAVKVKVGAQVFASLTDSERERLEGEGAIALHATMARTNHPTLAATSAWGKYQAKIEANLAAQAATPEPVITEIGDQ